MDPYPSRQKWRHLNDGAKKSVIEHILSQVRFRGPDERSTAIVGALEYLFAGEDPVVGARRALWRADQRERRDAEHHANRSFTFQVKGDDDGDTVAWGNLNAPTDPRAPVARDLTARERAVLAAVAALPDYERGIIHGLFYSDTTMQEVASTVDVSRSTLFRRDNNRRDLANPALQLLREKLPADLLEDEPSAARLCCPFTGRPLVRNEIRQTIVVVSDPIDPSHPAIEPIWGPVVALDPIDPAHPAIEPNFDQERPCLVDEKRPERNHGQNLNEQIPKWRKRYKEWADKARYSKPVDTWRHAIHRDGFTFGLGAPTRLPKLYASPSCPIGDYYVNRDPGVNWRQIARIDGTVVRERGQHERKDPRPKFNTSEQTADRETARQRQAEQREFDSALMAP